MNSVNHESSKLLPKDRERTVNLKGGGGTRSIKGRHGKKDTRSFRTDLRNTYLVFLRAEVSRTHEKIGVPVTVTGQGEENTGAKRKRIPPQRTTTNPLQPNQGGKDRAEGKKGAQRKEKGCVGD